MNSEALNRIIDQLGNRQTLNPETVEYYKLVVLGVIASELTDANLNLNRIATQLEDGKIAILDAGKSYE